MEFKGNDENQVQWINSLRGFFTALVAYIKQYHTTGVSWKAGGEDASKYIGAAAPAAPAGAPAGPPPPGPPPPSFNAAEVKKGPDMGALFSSIQQGVGISSGLKKVTSDMKTKNRKPEERVAVVKDVPKKAAPVSRNVVKKGTPKFALEGNKWVVEFQDDKNNLEISDTEPKQTVYLYKNDRTVVNIKGPKINSICVDSCNKTAIVFNSAIAVVEVVNCNGLEIQCTGKVPAFAVDKSSSVQIILSKECLDTEIVTSKSDQVNIQIPVEGEQDLVELAVPEQYKTVVQNGKLVTTCVEHV
jgi:adenylyl cyclase-associated protein